MILLRNKEEIAHIRKAAQMVRQSLDEVQAVIKPGVTTWELNEVAEKTTIRLGGKPAFKGYGGGDGRVAFPAGLCTSVNHEIVHGIPRKDCVLKEGDIIGIDYGVNLNGFFGDSARTIPVGFEPEGRLKELIDSTKESLNLAIQAIKPGGWVQDISRAIDDYIRPKGFGIVYEYVGHGIGNKPHEEPPIPHFLTREKGARLKPGMVICIEPMVNMGTADTQVLEDDWTVVTADGELSAHFEHTIAITEAGPEVLSGGGPFWGE